MQDFLQFMAAIGLVAAGAGYGLSQWKKGRNDSKKDTLGISRETMDLLQSQISSLQALVADSKKEIQLLQHEVIKLQTQLIEKEKMLDQYTLILQGRDEDTKRFQREGFEAMKQTKAIQEELGNVGKNMVRLTEAIEKHLATLETIRVSSPTNQ